MRHQPILWVHAERGATSHVTVRWQCAGRVAGASVCGTCDARPWRADGSRCIFEVTVIWCYRYPPASCTLGNQNSAHHRSSPVKRAPRAVNGWLSRPVVSKQLKSSSCEIGGDHGAGSLRSFSAAQSSWPNHSWRCTASHWLAVLGKEDSPARVAQQKQCVSVCGGGSTHNQQTEAAGFTALGVPCVF
eukprot:COSAG01_NODE_2889_length_6907_cov_43.104877_6_plen_188_part_00